MTTTETCGNCGREIGRTETAHVFGNSVICHGCRVAAATKCPNCQSDNTSAATLIVDRQPGAKIGGAMLGDSIGIVLGTVKTESEFARRLFPAMEPGPSGVPILLVVLSVVGAIAATFFGVDLIGDISKQAASMRLAAWISAGLLIFVAVLCVFLHASNTRSCKGFEIRNAARLSTFRNTWACLRCGHSWVIDDAKP